MASKPVIGLALGSGGARGWCHIGVLRELQDMGIEPDVVAGCSMGALVGAAYAGGRLDQLEEWARALTRRKFLTLIDINPSGGGLVEGKGINRLFEDIGLGGNIEDLERPFHAIASDMRTGREIWLKEGPVALAVRASAAIPGVFGPARVQGRWLLDGGMTNPVPVSVARALGGEVLIASNPNAHLTGAIWRPAPETAASSLRGMASQIARHLPGRMKGLENLFIASGPRSPGYLSVVNAAIDMMTEQIRRSRLAGDPPHVLLNADLEAMYVLELYRANDAIEEGRRMVRRNREMLLAAIMGEDAAQKERGTP